MAPAAITTTRPPPRRRGRSSSTPAFALALLGTVLLVLFLPSTTPQPDTAGYRDGWRLHQYPNPSQEGEAARCGAHHVEAKGSTSFLCDPDGLLSKKGAIAVHEALDKLHADVLVDCPGGGEQQGLQLGVALAHKIKRTTHDAVEEAEGFARALHNTWGVGDATCQNGALLFISRVDRTIYLSRGKGLERLLTDNRIDKTIQDVKQYLREQDWDAGVLLAVQQVGGWVAQGPPGFWEENAGMVLLLLVIAAFIAYSIHQERKKLLDRRAYDDAKRKLERIERERARLASLELADSYESLISCPICLEEFTDGSALEEKGEHGQLKHGTDKCGSDGKPVSILGCGHAYCNSCLLLALERERVPRCPICRRTLDEGAAAGGNGGPPPDQGGGGGGGGGGGFGGFGGGALGGSGDSGAGGPPSRSGSGLEAGRGASNGSSSSSSSSSSSGGRCRVDEDYHSSSSSTAAAGGGGGGLGGGGIFGGGNAGQARRLFAEAEILYRLSQLQRQHPSVVRPEMVNRWTQRGYEGRFTADSTFVNANPSVRFAQQQQAYGSSGFTSGGGGRRAFGGGSSSGGRGSRW